ncbi:MAG: SIMPL domain-containing protein [Candidatus Gracilibacteria bacterium]
MFECKPHHRVIGVALLVVALALAIFLGFRSYQISREIYDYSREITVEAQGTSYASPDLATISLGVTTEAVTAEKAVKDNTKKMNDVIAKIKELGIEGKDIQSTNYYLNPKYNWSEAKGNYEDGYTISQDILIKVRDLTKVGEVLTASTEAGANVIGSVSFSIENPEKAKSEARDIAIANAKEKAKLIEEQTGLNIGKISNYYEYQDYSYDYGKGGGGYAFAEGGGGGEIVSATIEPGQEQVTLNVSLTFKIR